MIECYFKNQEVAERLRGSVLGPQLNTFASVVSELGYSHATILTQIHLLAGLVRWIQKNEIVISDIDEHTTNLFLNESARKGVLRRGDKNTLRCFLDHLRVEGLIDYSTPTFNYSPLASLKKRYENYLRKERGLSSRSFTSRTMSFYPFWKTSDYYADFNCAGAKRGLRLTW